MPNVKWLVGVAAAWLAVWVAAGPALAAPGDQVTVGIGIMVASSVRLTMTPNSINFPDADPNTTPSIPASENPVRVRCELSGSGHSDLYLYAAATGDLKSTSDSIPISQISWTASGSEFRAGTMSTTPVLAGYWAASGSKTYTGTFSYFLNNDWKYASGTYKATVIYTLFSP